MISFGQGDRPARLGSPLRRLFPASDTAIPDSPVGSDDGEISAASTSDRRLDDHRPVLVATRFLRRQTNSRDFWQGGGAMESFVEGLRFLSIRPAALGGNGKQTQPSSTRSTSDSKDRPMVKGLSLPVFSATAIRWRFQSLMRAAKFGRSPKAGITVSPIMYTASRWTAPFTFRMTRRPLLLSRFGRLGWLLRQIKGPNNIDIEPRCLKRHEHAFFEAGIPTSTEVPRSRI